jgi:hypothetical protein
MRLLRNCYHMLWVSSESSSDDDVFVTLIPSQLVQTAAICRRNGHTTLLLYHAVTLLLFCFLLQVLAPSGETFLPLDLVDAQDPVTKTLQRLEYLPSFQSNCCCVTY